MIVFNWESGIEGQPSVFREAQLRQALQRALDRTAIVGRNLYQTAVLTDWAVPLGSWMMTHDVPNYPTFNPSEALRLIQTIELYPTPPPTDTEAVSADVTPETPPTPTVEPRRAFRFVVIDEAAYVNMATEISQQWSAIGFNSEVIPEVPMNIATAFPRAIGTLPLSNTNLTRPPTYIASGMKALFPMGKTWEGLPTVTSVRL
jgi:ABC-type transport system substrate-binding protein